MPHFITRIAIIITVFVIAWRSSRRNSVYKILGVSGLMSIGLYYFTCPVNLFFNSLQSVLLRLIGLYYFTYPVGLYIYLITVSGRNEKLAF
jgi:hypothetical protein